MESKVQNRKLQSKFTDIRSNNFSIPTMPRSTSLERRIVITKLIQTSVFIAMGFPALYFLPFFQVPPLPRLIDRLVFTLRLQTFSVAPLVLAIANVSVIRLLTPAIDPLNGKAEHLVLFPARYLQNTLEQYILHFVGVLNLSCYLNENQMKVVPIAVLFFVTGRITFYLGYKSSYLKRTIGYVMTYLPSVLLWIVNLGLLMKDMVFSSSRIQ